MPDTTERLYFAYGSNINLDQMAFRCPAAQVVSPVTLNGYRLLFRGDYCARPRCAGEGTSVEAYPGM